MTRWKLSDAPIAILSDVHANLHALEAVLSEVEARGITEWWCLGDVVGYGAQPRECLRICLEGATRCLAGNHDLGASGQLDLEDFSPDAAIALRWTAVELDDASIDRLAALTPAHIDGETALFHGSPRDPVWEYVLSPRQAEIALVGSPGRITMVGHSHLPMAWNLPRARDKIRRFNIADGPLTIGEGRWLINPGSVGQPRDHDPRASWAVYEPDKDQLEIIRTDYDIVGAQRAIRRAGLPEILAHRLAEGR